MRNIAMIPHDFFGFFTGISCVRAKMLFGMSSRFSDSIFQNLVHLCDIMPISSGYDDRQRDATLVDKNMSFGSIFFPDQ